MAHSSHRFNNCNPYPSNRKIATIDGLLTTIIGVGDVQICPTPTLRNMLHVPKLSTNLVFIQKAYTRIVLQYDFLPYYVF